MAVFLSLITNISQYHCCQNLKTDMYMHSDIISLLNISCYTVNIDQKCQKTNSPWRMIGLVLFQVSLHIWSKQPSACLCVPGQILSTALHKQNTKWHFGQTGRGQSNNTSARGGKFGVLLVATEIEQQIANRLHLADGKTSSGLHFSLQQKQVLQALEDWATDQLSAPSLKTFLLLVSVRNPI